MPLLFSNYPPLRTRFDTYSHKFNELMSRSDQVSIASGYFSTDSAVDLRNLIEVNKGPNINICLGMNYFEGFTPNQLESLQNLNNSLKLNHLGQVYLVTTFPFHGKMVSFLKNSNVIGSIVGSSNMSNILDGQRQYEADYFFDACDDSNEINNFINEIINNSSKSIDMLDIKIVQPSNNLLENQLGVEKVDPSVLRMLKSSLTNISFKISLKGDESPKSGLNVFFGEGRKNQQGYIKPRPWYEVELIVPKSITTLPYYPKADPNSEEGSLNVYTDDGWHFRCKVSGDYSKNFRSEDDLKILGKWIKGRLELANALKPGELVTAETFKKYGRSDIILTKLNTKNNWYLDFGKPDDKPS
jgi:hypothetical protein